MVNGNGLISTASTNAEGYAGTVIFDDVDTIHLNDGSVVGSFVKYSRFMGEDTAEDVPESGVLMDNIDALVLNGGIITAETNSEIPGGYINIHNVNEVLLENGAEINAVSRALEMQVVFLSKNAPEEFAKARKKFNQSFRS